MSKFRCLSSLILLSVSISLFACSRPGPLSTIDGIRSAIRDSSYLKFEEYVAVDRLMPEINERALERATERYSDGMENVDVERWAEVLKTAVRGCVRGETTQYEDERCQYTTSALAFLGVRPSEYVGATVVDQIDSAATLRLDFQNARLDTTVSLQVRTKRHGERWRIISLENLPAVASAVQRQQDSVLQVVNDSVLAEIQKRADARIQIERESGTYLDEVEAIVILENLSEKPINYASLKFGKYGDSISGTFPASTADPDTLPPLQPRESVRLQSVLFSMPCPSGTQITICRFEDGETPSAVLRTLEFTDGERISTFSSWSAYAFAKDSTD